MIWQRCRGTNVGRESCETGKASRGQQGRSKGSGRELGGEEKGIANRKTKGEEKERASLTS